MKNINFRKPVMRRKKMKIINMLRGEEKKFNIQKKNERKM